MKRFVFIAAAVILAAVSAASCTKTATGFRGNYSFKTSGILYAVRDSAFIYDTTIISRRDGDEWVKDTVITANPDSMVVSVPTESGQMDITQMSGARDLVTMNCTAGDLVVYFSNESDGLLTLEKARRKISLSLSTTTIGEDEEITVNSAGMDADIIVTGTATRYSNILLFTLRYDGTFKYNDILYHIYDSEVYCRAKDN